MGKNGERARAGMVISAAMSLLLIVAPGCVSRKYRVMLRDNQVIHASTRPKVDKETGMYRFKDTAGRPVVVPTYHVREIEIR